MREPALNREQSIRQMAYALWEAEGYPHGRHLHHWKEAETRIAMTEAAAANDEQGAAAAKSVEGFPLVKKTRGAPGKSKAIAPKATADKAATAPSARSVRARSKPPAPRG
jgi:hypothetical protein